MKNVEITHPYILFASQASTVVQALHKADIGEGPRPREVLPPVAIVSSPSADNAPRLVFPGPSYALAEVVVRQNDAGEWALYAKRDFAFGERVYEFWRCDWPFGGRSPIDMVASTKLGKYDLAEGTVINIDPHLCAAKKDRSGHFQFSGFDLFASHCCEPNLTYNDIHEDEDDDWQGAYATRAIKSGEVLTIDFNSVFWDRSSSPGARECGCGSSKCAGTKAGFKVRRMCCEVMVPEHTHHKWGNYAINEMYSLLGLLFKTYAHRTINCSSSQPMFGKNESSCPGGACYHLTTER